MVSEDSSGKEITVDSNSPSSDSNTFRVSWVNASGEPEEGPLSLLWQLIESYRIDIFEISLRRITEDFLSFLKSAGELKIDLASAFAVMAAKLLYYKSKALLPDPGFDEPDQEDRLPPELIQQLLEYRKFQMAAEKIRDLADVSSGMFTRESGFSVEIEENSVWLDVSLMDLIQAYSGIIKKYESAAPEEAGFEVEEDVFTVEEKIDMIKKLLENAASFLFEDLFENISAMKKGEIIVTFLAILELVKSGDILVRQKEIFGPIYIFKKSVTVI